MASLKKHLFSAYAGYFFRYVYLIVLIPFYARVLGPDAYGLVLAAMSVQAIVWTIQNWGFSFAGSRNIAGAHSDVDRNKEFRRHITARFILTPLAAGAGIAFSFGSPLLRAHPQMAGLAILCGVLAGFNLGWYFQGRMNFRTPVFVEIAGFVITLSMALTLVRSSADAIYVMVSLATSGMITNAVAYFIAAKSEKIRPSNIGSGFKLIKESTHLFITGGTAALMTNVGTYSLATFASPAQVAYFGTAEKVAVTGLGLLAPVGQVMLSWFSKMMKENNDAKEVLRQQKQAVRWVSIAGGLATLASLTVAPPLLNLVLGEKFEHASLILRVISPIFLLAAFNNSISIYIFLPRRMEREISAISMATTVSGIFLTAGGAWLHGAVGAAVGRVIAEFSVSVALMALYRQKRESFQ